MRPALQMFLIAWREMSTSKIVLNQGDFPVRRRGLIDSNSIIHQMKIYPEVSRRTPIQFWINGNANYFSNAVSSPIVKKLRGFVIRRIIFRSFDQTLNRDRLLASQTYLDQKHFCPYTGRDNLIHFLSRETIRSSIISRRMNRRLPFVNVRN